VTDLAVITGTTHGIGRVTARELARAGYEVVMLCRNQPAARAVREEILQAVAGASIHVIPCDLASLASVRTAAALVLERFSEIRLLVNNAGITTMRRQQSVDGFELDFATNHLGPFLLTELLRGRMAAPGRIINVASRAGHRGDSPKHWHYAAAKGGMLAMTKTIARGYAAQGILAFAITPGFTESETQMASSSANYVAGRDQARCFKRPQYPDDLVGAVMFLISDASAFITGQTIVVDGGQTLPEAPSAMEAI
jgi:NAD(P)-dependent dehydrogenase (short-subunit alcohol dehydrogenase family)